MQVDNLPSWRALQQHAARLGTVTTEALFGLEPDRLDYLAFEAAGIYVDLSKNRVDREAVRDLLALAADRDLAQAIGAMFDGESVNVTEDRPALHTLLRASLDSGEEPLRTGRLREIGAVKEKIRSLSRCIRAGQLLGFGGAVIRNVVNIGIGGSHLGPQLVCEALRYEQTSAVNVHFVSNVDGGDIDRVLAILDPETTLFIISSKSFTTTETLLNATTARNWIQTHFKNPAANLQHFAAVTARPDRAIEFGIDEDKLFPMWDWVGGRYSLWSAIGLSIAIAVGSDEFEQLLAGAHAMDEHFRTAAPASNVPVMLALIGIWNSNFLKHDTLAIVPYDDRLTHLPEYLQQLEMESNGKRVTLGGLPVNYDTAPIIWGGVGTNVQHAFFQLLHQGTRNSAIDFIVSMTNSRSDRAHQDMLIANCIAQAEGLMLGRNGSAPAGAAGNTGTLGLGPHRACPGNRPSTMIVLDELGPRTFGALLALYEHKTYVQAVLWNINPFDQWGVEIGKQLADSILQEFRENQSARHDPSTNALIARYRKLRTPD